MLEPGIPYRGSHGNFFYSYYNAESYLVPLFVYLASYLIYVAPTEFPSELLCSAGLIQIAF